MMHTLKKGILIAIEGIDGSGKSTLAKNLYDQLSKQQYPVLLTKEPGATPLGQYLRTLVQEKRVPITAKAEFLLFAADRAQHFADVILPNLQQNKIIISDRMADSSIVYQGYGRCLDTAKITMINEWVMQNKRPDITIYVHVSTQIAAERILQRNVALTSFEKEKQEFIQKLMHGFDTLYKDRKDVIIVDGTQSPEKVTAQALQEIVSRLHNSN